MIVKLIPGPRNEELIRKVREAKRKDEGVFGVIDAPIDELFDALYYACECGDIMLEDQRQYLQRLLINEETGHYEERMLSDCTHDDCMEKIKTTLERDECGAWKLTGIQRDSCQEHSATFAICEHTDGWDYYYTDHTSGYMRDGIYDDPEKSPYEVACYLFEEAGFFLTWVGEALDFEAVSEEYYERLEQKRKSESTQKGR